MFIGASAPEAGGLRATGDDPLTASVAIQARAARADSRRLRAGGDATLASPGASASALGAALIALAIFAPAPLAYAAAAIALAAPFPAALCGRPAPRRLIDPLEIVRARARRLRRGGGGHGRRGAAARAGVARAFRAPSGAAGDRAHHRQRAINRSSAASGARSQLCSPTSRGFTGMVGRAEPEALVAALDGYFEGITRIGLAHGGMIDKFVGDAAHVFFNMPFDLADHATKALDCAIEIVRWTEGYRARARPRGAGLRPHPRRSRKRAGAGRRRRRRGEARLYRARRHRERRRAARAGQQGDRLGDLRRPRRDDAHRARAAASGRRTRACADFWALRRPPRRGRTRRRSNGARAISRLSPSGKRPRRRRRLLCWRANSTIPPPRGLRRGEGS